MITHHTLLPTAVETKTGAICNSNPLLGSETVRPEVEVEPSERHHFTCDEML